MLIAMVTVFLQFQLAIMYSEVATGNEPLLSWIEARETCANISYTILPGMPDEHILSSMAVGEFAWIDGKEYTFCMEKNTTDVKGTTEQCRYVTVRREDKRKNLTCICSKVANYETKGEMLPYADVVEFCSKSNASLLVVERFHTPMVIPVNRTYWIGEYHDVRITNILSPGQTVTHKCIGIVKLDHDKSEFCTASCNETHAIICDAAGVDTATTLTIRHEMMPSLDALKARIASNQRQDDMIVILGSTFGGIILLVVFVAIVIIAIIRYRKKKSNQNFASIRGYQKRKSNQSFASIREYRTQQPNVSKKQDGEIPPRENVTRQGEESESYALVCKSFKVNDNTQCYGK